MLPLSRLHGKQPFVRLYLLRRFLLASLGLLLAGCGPARSVNPAGGLNGADTLTSDQFKNQPESTVREGTVDGRRYTIAGPELSALVIRYRKDWFREAGIRNEKGEPGPPAHWTWEDFRQIAKKITDPKRGRFGFAGQMNDFLYNNAHDINLFIPDPTGQHTWVFNDRDPKLIQSLQAAREMYNVDKS